MKTTRTLIVMAAFAGSIMLNSCAKDGAVGPAGPAGTNGNANVQSSTFTVSNWTYSAPSYYSDISWGALTTDIINNGAVLVYVSTGTSVWSQLPLTLYTYSTYSSSLEVVSSTGNIRILWTDSDLTQPNNPGANTFKVVAIAASQRLANPNINYDDYNQVKAAFHLKD